MCRKEEGPADLKSITQLVLLHRKFYFFWPGFFWDDQFFHSSSSFLWDQQHPYYFPASFQHGSCSSCSHTKKYEKCGSQLLKANTCLLKQRSQIQVSCQGWWLMKIHKGYIDQVCTAQNSLSLTVLVGVPIVGGHVSSFLSSTMAWMTILKYQATVSPDLLNFAPNIPYLGCVNIVNSRLVPFLHCIIPWNAFPCIT
jgi:hypothetical protein